ncbi:MAG: ArnT family glycosyltransferase [Gemmataceae bacterium]
MFASAKQTVPIAGAFQARLPPPHLDRSIPISLAPTPISRSLLRPRNSAFFVAFLLTLHASLLAWEAYVHSPTIDEVGHMAAGLSHWQLGRFDLYRVNPPLVRVVAAIPVLLSEPKVNWGGLGQNEKLRYELGLGAQFIELNDNRWAWYFTIGRWACIPFSILGAFLCYIWAKDAFGLSAGLLSLSLWCFCPNILAHGSLITPDVGATSLGLLAFYTFRNWLNRPRWDTAFIAGVCFGIAQLTKMTWVILFPLWPALWIALSCYAKTKEASSRQLWQVGQMAMMLIIGVWFINLGYCFEGSFQPLNSYEFLSESLGGERGQTEPLLTGKNRFTGTWAGNVLVPLPKNYVLGIDSQKRDFEQKLWSYLNGEWKQGGWWYYYLFGIAMKVPLGTLALILLAALFTLLRPSFVTSSRESLVLLTPVLAILVLVSSQTGFNHHLRYVLPIFPFVFIWASSLAHAVQGFVSKAVLAALLIYSTLSSLSVFPHSLSYFNELAGGPTCGHAHLIDSNIDWGQDLLLLRKWLNAHPEAKPLKLAYFGAFDPRSAGIAYSLPPASLFDNRERRCPTGLEPGWYAVSVSLLEGREYPVYNGLGAETSLQRKALSYFLSFKPVAMAGYSIYIYHVSAQDIWTDE